MKTIKLLIALMAVCVSAAHAQFTKAELQVSGLTCSMCSKATEKSLKTLDFVSDIKTDLNRNLFLITFKPGTPVNLEQIGKKVKNAGFSINNLKATFNFDKVKISNSSFTYAGDTYRVVNAADQSLNGLVSVTVVNKGFAPAAVYKKYNSPAISASGAKAWFVAI